MKHRCEKLARVFFDAKLLFQHFDQPSSKADMAAV